MAIFRSKKMSLHKFWARSSKLKKSSTIWGKKKIKQAIVKMSKTLTLETRKRFSLIAQILSRASPLRISKCDNSWIWRQSRRQNCHFSENLSVKPVTLSMTSCRLCKSLTGRVGSLLKAKHSSAITIRDYMTSCRVVWTWVTIRPISILYSLAKQRHISTVLKYSLKTRNARKCSDSCSNLIHFWLWSRKLTREWASMRSKRAWKSAVHSELRWKACCQLSDLILLRPHSPTAMKKSSMSPIITLVKSAGLTHIVCLFLARKTTT